VSSERSTFLVLPIPMEIFKAFMPGKDESS